MQLKISLNRSLFPVLLLALLAGCAPGIAQTPAAESEEQATAAAVTAAASASGSQDSHGNDAAPNYAVVFPQDLVNRIDITLTAQAWSDLQSEMEEQFGQPGDGDMRPGPGQPPRDTGQRPPDLLPGDQPPGDQPPGGWPPLQAGTQQPPDMENFSRGGGMGPRGGLDFGDTSYVESTISFNGETWEHVGFRYSGNSTLQNSWRSGTKKISFRLDFDEFEDDFPATKNQRFFGFKQLSFKSNAMDSSYLREKVTADIFREAGVVSSQTAFYEVYVDYGEGQQYFGLYTVVEIVDDTVIKSQFASDSGNVYKPEGSGAAFVEGTFTEESFEKQTNDKEGDWSDIEAVFAALHSDLRASDPAAWRAELEKVFDTGAFIRWLAADTIIQNWDTYGAMAHNYYLYTDPSDGKVTWIPWDNNMALSASGMAPAGRDRGRGGQSVRALDLSTVGEQWPLIRYLMDDPVYQAQYRQDLQEMIQSVWLPEKLTATYQRYHDLIAPYVEKENTGYTQLSSPDEFDQALNELIQHTQERYEAVKTFLASQ